MTPAAILARFTEAVAAGDGPGFAALFTPDATYHDVFYGAFHGRERISAMLTDWFRRDATAFRWDMHDPVSDGTTLYARYVFSFTSKLPAALGRRVMFEGVSIITLQDGLIAEYREVANTAPGLVDLGFAPDRLHRRFAKESSEFRSRPESTHHL